MPQEKVILLQISFYKLIVYDILFYMNGKSRSNIKPGITVFVVQKHHQRSGELTEGIVQDILTNSSNHPHGIKVRLESGIVGRVQEIK